MAIATVHQPAVDVGAAAPSIAARLTRFVIIWTVAAALLDELSDLRSDRSGR